MISVQFTSFVVLFCMSLWSEIASASFITDATDTKDITEARKSSGA